MAYATNQSAIDAFRSEYYPEVVLAPTEIETLSWCMNNPITTPSGEPSVDVHFEVKRALNRLSNMEMLRVGNYDAFIANQAEPKMSRGQFNFFAEKIQELTKDEFIALRAMTIIGSVSLSPEARTRATAHLGKHPADSIEFLDVTLQKCPEMYPVYAALAPSTQPLLQESFAFGHLRHMLYIEGNQGMFKAVEDACARITESETRQKYFDFWYLQWFINITGFKVLTDPAQDPHGSSYLHYGNAEALSELHRLLDSAVKDPSQASAMLPTYLAFRAERLALEGEEGSRSLITQIVAWSRIYGSDAKVTILQAAVAALPGDALIRPDAIRTRTPTYVPAVFDNILSLVPAEPQLAFYIALSIYLSASKTYLKATCDKDSFSLPPLNFRLAADKTGLQAIIADVRRFPARQAELPCCEVALNDRYEVTASPKPAPSLRTFEEMGGATVTADTAEFKL